MRERISLKDFCFINSDIESLSSWQTREALVPIVDPEKWHCYLRFLQMGRKLSHVGTWMADLSTAVFPSFIIAFPDAVSQRVSASIIAGLGVSKIILGALIKGLESAIKEESKEILFKTFHAFQDPLNKETEEKMQAEEV